jgi:hypothetical protein
VRGSVVRVMRGKVSTSWGGSDGREALVGGRDTCGNVYLQKQDPAVSTEVAPLMIGRQSGSEQCRGVWRVCR